MIKDHIRKGLAAERKFPMITNFEPEQFEHGLEALTAVNGEDMATHDQSVFVHERLKRVDYREREIIKYYFGLDGNSPLTLDEIGRKFRVTKERIRQLKIRGMEKMKVRGGLDELCTQESSIRKL